MHPFAKLLRYFKAIIYELLDIFSPNVEYPTMYDTVSVLDFRASRIYLIETR